MKRKITFYLVMFMLIFNISLVSADIDTNSVVNAQSVITNLVDSINQRDWDVYTSLQANENQIDYREFFNNPANKDNNVGLFNIKSAELKEIRPLPNSLASRFTKISQYQEEFNEIYSFLAGIDYRVKNENKYYFNGVNYRLVVLGKEKDKWQIVEMSDAPIEILIPLGYGFDSSDEKKALKIVEERIKGNIITSNDNVVETNRASYQDIQLEKGVKINELENDTIEITSLEDHTRPDYVRVYRTSLGYTQSIDFYSYVKNVLPNEWDSTWDDEALRAGAMAGKMYGWYHVYHPKWPQYNADVKDNAEDQKYVPNSEVTSCTLAINYVGGIGLENSDGDVFEAQYLKGTYDDAGMYSGKVSQYGTKYWADLGIMNYLDMLHWYYDYSDKSLGEISTFSY